MIQAIIVKAVIGKIMDAIEKADDKRIASNHDARITKLEKMAHPQADWICLECKCKATRKELPTKKGDK